MSSIVICKSVLFVPKEFLDLFEEIRTIISFDKGSKYGVSSGAADRLQTC